MQSMDNESPLTLDSFDEYCLDIILKMLDIRDLSSMAQCSRLWRDVINRDCIWRVQARKILASKQFVAAIVEGLVSSETRPDLNALSGRQLKNLCVKYGLLIDGGLEKSEVCAAIDRYEMSFAAVGECRARFATRIAIVDATRNQITARELCSLTWRHRLRLDGALSQIAGHDPWHHSETGDVASTVSFFAGRTENSGTFKYSLREDSPLRLLGPRFLELQGDDQLQWNLQGQTLELTPIGAHAILCRHPITWGWVMILPASVWTSWPMPPRGKDPFLEDFNLHRLVKPTDCGFSFTKKKIT